jgi:hypothetical protein
MWQTANATAYHLTKSRKDLSEKNFVIAFAEIVYWSLAGRWDFLRRSLM